MLISMWARSSRYVVLLAICVLVACSSVDATRDASRQTAADAQPNQIVKSDNDRRDYRYLKLPNTLRVLLISDPQTDKSAASMDVHVGSGADPEDFQGLAHFLEHMLFLGTEKYPQAGEYQAFITAHGGGHNAFTSFEHTNYFFDIDPDYLDETLDRFAQFFIAPLFTEQYVEREKNAVHSEYMAKVKDDQRRALDAFKSVVNPQHPFAKFSVGNLDTLTVNDGKPALRDQLLRFYNQHYSSSIMTLVVMGRESLPELERMVKDKFAQIPDRGVTPATIDAPLFSAAHYPLPLFLSIQPEKEQRTLSIAFPTDEEIAFYRHKPLQYIGNILGHEGRGSLLSWLKDKGWAEGVSAGTGLSYRGGATFNISLKLTREGVAHVDDIVTAVFQTLNRARETPAQQRIFDEQRQLAEQSFRYRENTNPMHYVMGLSSGMHYYDPADLLRGPYLMTEYDETLIARFLADLVPENSIVTLNAPEAHADRNSYFYQTPFSVAPVSAAQLAKWQGAALNDAIVLPAPNPFIADSLSMKADQFTDSERAAYNDDKPRLIQQGAGYKLWYKPDSQFLIPKGSLLVNVKSPLAGDSAEHQALLNMFTALVSDQLNELSYPAALAGLNYVISPNSSGFSIKINGFDDKQLRLLDEVLAVFDQADFEPLRFDIIKRDQIRRLENTIKEQPYHRVMASLPAVLYREQLTPEDLLRVYPSITLARLHQFYRQMMTATELDILVHGNYRQAEAEQLALRLRSVLHSGAHPIADLEIADLEVVQLDRAQYVLPAQSDYTDSALLLYIQGADLDLQTRAALGLTAQILRADFYTQLRTEKQLGYIVTSGVYPARDVPGIFFLIQSPVAAVGSLREEITRYLAAQSAMVEQMTEQQFSRQREALVLRLAEAPKNLWAQSERYWQDIVYHHYDFDSKAQLIAALQALSLEDWRRVFKEQVATLDRAVWIYAKGDFEDAETIKGVSLENLAKAKQEMRYYHFPR